VVQAEEQYHLSSSMKGFVTSISSPMFIRVSQTSQLDVQILLCDGDAI